jgi:hypothetical protein
VQRKKGVQSRSTKQLVLTAQSTHWQADARHLARFVAVKLGQRETCPSELAGSSEEIMAGDMQTD